MSKPPHPPAGSCRTSEQLRATPQSLRARLDRNRCECDCPRPPAASRRRPRRYRSVLRRGRALHALRATTRASNARALPLARFPKLKTFASNNGFQTIGAAKITVKQRFLLPHLRMRVQQYS